uniref:V-SNARE coiled-coil homology domain-containing protein n=1 Tax=Timema genevievae TaxID=629358 RepID=A0A7R9JWG3_TIMGE|nr:unnamed protein product [Timema genevievae]
MYGAVEWMYGTVERMYGAVERMYGAVGRMHGTVERMYGAAGGMHGAAGGMHKAVDRIYRTSTCEMCVSSQSLSEMVGELFLPHDMPEAPKESFFKGLFGGGLRSLDREELFGESSGRASRSVAKHIPGPQAAIQDLDKRVTGLTSEVGRAHQLMVERGEKLGKLEDRAEKMASEAENFSHTSHSLMLKYKDKKWYQL